MTEQELKEKIGLEICEHNDAPCSFCILKVKAILALIKEALPKLAKGAGYVKLEKGQHISGIGSQELPDVIGTTLDGQPLIKQVGGK